MKKFLICFIFNLFIIAFATSIYAASKNMIRNPSLEKSCSPWSAPSYWAGHLSWIGKSGVAYKSKGCMKLVTTEKSGKYFGRIYQATKIKNPIGLHFKYSLWVKGQGEFILGIIKYTPKPGKGYNCGYHWMPAPVKLTGKWQNLSFEFDVKNPQVHMISVVAELRGEKSHVYIDDVSLKAIQAPELSLESLKGHMVLPVGSICPEFSFKLTKSGKPLPEAATSLYIIAPDGKYSVTELVTGNNGKCRYLPKNKELKEPGTWRIVCSAIKFGIRTEMFIDVMNKGIFNQTDSIAKRVKVKNPLRILYLGDSLTDFYRGHNYTDKINFWLNKYNPGTASFINAGVGGDFITRMWKRIQGIDGRRKAYRQNMYDGLFDKKTDMVFIFLGHNDTKADSASNYRKPVVNTKTQEETYRKVIAYIRSKSNAKIVLLTSSSSFFPRCKALTEKLAKLGRKHVLFGQPEKLEAFNTVIKKLSKELNLDCVDVYTPTQKHPDKAQLFDPNDGIHLTEKGNDFIAMLLLDYLAMQNGL
jgi:lysophospholipase L1-like esterase